MLIYVRFVHFNEATTRKGKDGGGKREVTDVCAKRVIRRTIYIYIY